MGAGMSSGKLYRSDLLRPGFAATLQAQAAQYRELERAKSGKEWLFGSLVNAEWDAAPDLRAEITKEQFYEECSRVINSGLPFPIVGKSGETLRRWCGVQASYANLPALAEFQAVLSFDHFYQARRMSLNPAYRLAAPDIALAQAVNEEWTAGEMVYHYSPKEPVHEYDKVIGWLDSLQGVKLDFIKTLARRQEAEGHLRAFREIVEAG